MRIFTLSLALLIAISALGNEKFSPLAYTFLQMHKQEANRQSLVPHVVPLSTADGVEAVDGFVYLADGYTAADVEAAGVEVATQVGNMLVVKMPVDGMEQLAASDAVARIDLARTLKQHNDQARSVTRADMVQAGRYLPQPYDGTGVLVGVIDMGIDFNHINFKDEDGNSRVVCAYSNGSTATSSTAISRLTCDTNQSSHGTHVAGIAAGSYTGNNYQGMAPGASLYLSGLGNGANTGDVITQMEAMANYASSRGMPLVVNISLGVNAGPHAGTDPVSQVCDLLSGQGRVFVFSAGNEGDLDIYINKQFGNASGTEQFSTLFDMSASYSIVEAVTDYPIDVQFFGISSYSGNVVCESSKATYSQPWMNWRLSDSDLANFGSYFNNDGNGIQVQQYYNEQIGKYDTYMVIGLSPAGANYTLGMRVFGTQGDEIHMYGDTDIEFTNNGNSAYTAGSPDGSISELATGREAISVGAYTSKVGWKAENGHSYYISGETVGHMASFSSYGTDMNGVQHPTIVAPGCVLVSSLSRYAFGTSSSNIVTSVEQDGQTYRWFKNQGTSMAAPAVTGIIATWLQYDPTLTPADIKEIFANTAKRDGFYGQGNAAQWGPNGLIDAYAGIESLAGSGVNDITKPQDVILVYPNPTDGQFSIAIPGEDTAQVEIFTMNGAKAFGKAYSGINGKIEINLQGQLQKGIYTLRVKVSKKNHTQKLIIK